MRTSKTWTIGRHNSVDSMHTMPRLIQVLTAMCTEIYMPHQSRIDCAPYSIIRTPYLIDYRAARIYLNSLMNSGLETGPHDSGEYNDLDSRFILVLYITAVSVVFLKSSVNFCNPKYEHRKAYVAETFIRTQDWSA
jgi:hypothetical protein